MISLYLLFRMDEIRSFVLWGTSIANVSKQIQYGHLKDKGTVKDTIQQEVSRFVWLTVSQQPHQEDHNAQDMSLGCTK